MIDDCDHEWSDEYLRLDGSTTQQCIKCPRWKLKSLPGRQWRIRGAQWRRPAGTSASTTTTSDEGQ